MRSFISLIILALIFSCQNPKKSTPDAEPFFKMSLAQWSFNKSFRSGGVSPYEFARLASELGFEGLEYVNQLYPDVMDSEDKSAAIAAFVEKNNVLAAQYKLQNVLIMIDSEGDLASSDENTRSEAIANHKLWIDAANQMGCSAVRLNLFGESDPEKWVANSILSLTDLADYAADKNINVIVENHGRLSSNVPVLMKVINGTGKSNCGTLPDFGNFCIAEEGYGSLFDGSCKEFYDPYKGVSEMIVKAFGVSAKSYDFDEEGNETTLDYNRLIKIVKDAGYKGFVGVEYEGSRLSEEEGIIATKTLFEKIGAKL
ncbi:sugar phosphate isomerase/epimerase [Flavobacteriaceae bacterium]|nr:sugar phosphate isomerase/epimerase [Flavobacteriaceae bacterium]